MGWASGLQAGIRLGETIRQGQLENALADESKKYKVTEGAYGPGLSENLQGVISARDQALQGLGEGATPEQIQQVHAQYTPAMAELSRRVGLSGPEYNVNGMGQNYASMEEAQRAANAQRTQGLADVYRSQGLVDKASELEARAQSQQLSGLQLMGAQRAEREAALAESLKGEDKKWWESRLTAEDGSRRAATPEDMLAAAQRGVSSSYSSGNFDKGNAAYSQYMDLAEKQVVGQERDRRRDGEKAFAAVQAGNLQAGMDFYNKYLPNGSIAKNATMDKNGMITVEHTDMSGNKLPDTKITKQQLLEGISSFGDSKQALAYVQQSFMNNLHTEELGLKKKSVEQTGQHYKDMKGIYNRPSSATIREFQDDKGNSVLVDTAQLPSKEGVLQIPKGLKPKSAHIAPSPADVTAQVKAMRAGRTDRHMVDGKMVPYTDEELAKRARSILSGEITMDPADLLIEQMRLANPNDPANE